MASLTLKNVPDSMLRDLRRAAERDRRSINQEIIYLLEIALRGRSRATTANEQQLTAWRELAGKWEADDDDVTKVSKRRTPGREVDL